MRRLRDREPENVEDDAEDWMGALKKEILLGEMCDEIEAFLEQCMTDFAFPPESIQRVRRETAAARRRAG